MLILSLTLFYVVYITLVNLKRHPVETATMSDVAPTANELACLICPIVAANVPGLRLHRMSVHKVIMSTARLRQVLKLPAVVPSTSVSTAAQAHGSSGVGGQVSPSRRPAAARESTVAGAGAGAAASGLDTGFVAEVIQGDGTAIDEAALGESPSDSSIAASVAASRVPAPPQRSRKRKSPGGSAPSTAPEFLYTTPSSHARGVYEDLGDEVRSSPLVQLRKAARTGRFNTPKLRELQRFVLKTGRGGLSLREQKRLYELLVTWDGADGGAAGTLQGEFPRFNAFAQALADDLDAAVVAAGWRKVEIEEDGITYRAYYRPVLDVVLALLDGQRVIKLWSGEGSPAPRSDLRDAPFDGDAFRLCEEDVCGLPGKNCVLGLHVFSDGSHISWSGGMFSGSASVEQHCVTGWGVRGSPLSGVTQVSENRHELGEETLTAWSLLHPSFSLLYFSCLLSHHTQPINCTLFEYGFSIPCRRRWNGSPLPTSRSCGLAKSPLPTCGEGTDALGCSKECCTWRFAQP